MATILLYSYSPLPFSPLHTVWLDASGLHHIGLSQCAGCMIKCVYMHNSILWLFCLLSDSLIEFARGNNVYNILDKCLPPSCENPEHDLIFNTV